MGQLGYNNTQETIALQLLLKQGERPQIVLFYDGINEMVCAEQTGAADRVMHEAARRAEFNIFYTDRRADLVKAGLIAAMPRTVRRLRELTGLAAARTLAGRPVRPRCHRYPGAGPRGGRGICRQPAADPAAGRRLRLPAAVFLAAGDHHESATRLPTSGFSNPSSPAISTRGGGCSRR